MRERPILFSAPMVRAILDGRKTQTRRIAKVPEWADSEDPSIPELVGPDPSGKFHAWNSEYPDEGAVEFRCPCGQPGDRLWVRETWGLHRPLDGTDWNRESVAGASLLPEEWSLAYRADWGSNQESCFWRPSIHMPRWASRLILEVTDVRVERLQDISEEDARTEGAYDAISERDGRGWDNDMDRWARWTKRVDPASNVTTMRGAFAALWSSINGPESWEANPWVWVVSFKRAQP